MRRERVGELFVIGSIALFALFPVVTAFTTKIMPPLMFAGASIFTTGICLVLYAVFNNKLRLFREKKSYAHIGRITVFNIIIPLSLIFIGASKTSAINTALLLQTELFFTFVICGLFFGEKITPQKTIGALVILIGACAILFRGDFHFNIGDLLIVAGTFFYPIGNFYQKKAIEISSPLMILLLRSLFGGAALIALSILFESRADSFLPLFIKNIHLILLNAVVVHLAAKFLWFEGLRRLDITKAIAIGASNPAFSLAYAYLFLKEIPAFAQVAGFIIIAVGFFILTRRWARDKAASRPYLENP